MALFGSKRDASFLLKINRELIGNVISQQCSIYKVNMDRTSVNIYGEVEDKYYFNGPFVFSALIKRDPQKFTNKEEGVKFERNVRFSFLRDDLKSKNVLPEVGDVILYEKSYYEINTIMNNEYFVGKNDEYPNKNSDGSINDLGDNLENFGSNISIVCDAHYVPADKYGISPENER